MLGCLDAVFVITAMTVCAATGSMQHVVTATGLYRKVLNQVTYLVRT